MRCLYCNDETAFVTGNCGCLTAMPATAASSALPLRRRPKPHIIPGVRNISGAKYWDLLHAERNPTPQWFKGWFDAITGCSRCKKDFARIVAEHPPDYSSPTAFFEWSIFVHNLVNIKLGRPEFSLDAAYRTHRGLVRLIEPPITDRAKGHTPQSDRLLIVVAVDAPSQAELNISRAGFIRYAKQVGADYVEITDAIQDCGHPTANKYAMLPYVEKYDQTLYCDVDVMIQPSATDIFELVPLASWDLVDDFVKNPDKTWFTTEIQEICDIAGIERYAIEKAWNSGVMVMPRHAHRSYFAPPWRLPDKWCCEQNFHTVMLRANSESIVELCDLWNLGYPWSDFLEKIDRAHFVHINGCKPHSLRLQIMEQIRDGKPITKEHIRNHKDSWKPGWFR